MTDNGNIIERVEEIAPEGLPAEMIGGGQIVPSIPVNTNVELAPTTISANNTSTITQTADSEKPDKTVDVSVFFRDLSAIFFGNVKTSTTHAWNKFAQAMGA